MKQILVFVGIILTSALAWSQEGKVSPPQSFDKPTFERPSSENPALDSSNSLALKDSAEESAITVLEKEMETTSDSKLDSKVNTAEKTLSEEQIPVLKAQEKTADAGSGPEKGSLHKVIVAFTIVILLFAGFIFGLKQWFQKKSLPGKQTSIRVVSQHFLGSKKSLAIVTVAGEYILLGVTDHNINLIKSLTLMDDEVPEQPKAFNSVLNQATLRPDFVDSQLALQTPSQERAQQERDADDGFSIRNIKEIVTSKLRGMKEFS